MTHSEPIQDDGARCDTHSKHCNSTITSTRAKTCTLDHASLHQRIQNWRDLFQLASQPVFAAGQVRFTFANQAETKAQLIDLIALERICCAHVSWQLDVDGTSIVLMLNADRNVMDAFVQRMTQLDRGD